MNIGTRDDATILGRRKERRVRRGKHYRALARLLAVSKQLRTMTTEYPPYKWRKVDEDLT